MKTLERRLTALEGAGGFNEFEHFTDEELQQRMVHLFEQLEAGGVGLPDDWREIVARNDLKAVDRMVEAAKCEILNAE